MKLSPLQMQQLVEKVFEHWKKNNLLTFKADEKVAVARAVQAVREDYEREAELERDVVKKLDELERTNSGEFQRHRMFPMLKEKMAKERKIIL